jgi:hypothetical protein
MFHHAVSLYLLLCFVLGIQSSNWRKEGWKFAQSGGTDEQPSRFETLQAQIAMRNEEWFTNFTSNNGTTDLAIGLWGPEKAVQLLRQICVLIIGARFARITQLMLII